MMDPIAFEASWWLPGEPETRVPGRVSFSENGVDLVLYGDLFTTTISDPARDETPSRWELWQYPILHGSRHSDSAMVSLLSVAGQVLISPIGPSARSAFSADALLVGRHVGSDSFTKICFGFDYLTVWSQPPPRQIHDPSDRDTLRLRTDSMIISDAETDFCDRIVLRSGLEGTEGSSSVRLDEFCVFDVYPAEPVQLDQANAFLQAARDLLLVSLERPVHTTAYFVYEEEADRGIDVYCSLPEPPLALPAERRSAQGMSTELFDYRMPTLFTAKGIGRRDIPLPLATLLSRWFSSYGEVAEAVGLLTLPHSMSSMYPEHRYQSLLGAVEELHRYLDLGSRELAKEDHQKRRDRVASKLAEADSLDFVESDLSWLLGLVANSRNDKSIPGKVRDLLLLTGPVGDAILAAADDFPRSVSRSRGKVSHGSAGSPETRRRRFVYEGLLRWVIRSIVLSRLVDEPHRAAFFEAASKYHHFEKLVSQLSSVSK